MEPSLSGGGRGGIQVIPRPANFELGGSPPWGEIAETERHASLERLREVLEAGGGSVGELASDPAASTSATNTPPANPSQDTNSPSIPAELAQETWRTSAVLIPLYEENTIDEGTTDNSELHVILTRRAAHLRSHSHEVSFPGGGQEEADTSLWETALRETREEISLNTDLAECIGKLPTFRTVGSKSLVHPFVSLIRGGRPKGLTPDPSEVEHILYVPMSELLRDDVFHEEIWQIPNLGTVTINFFQLQTDTIWGATAAILRQLLTTATTPETASTPTRQPSPHSQQLHQH